MNGITHFLVGIVITLFIWKLFSNERFDDMEWANKEVFTLRNKPVRTISLLRIILTSIFAFFSHAIVDGFAIFTYHPYKNFDILFYRIWTPILLISGAVTFMIAIKKDIRFIYGLVFAIFFDLWDYSVLGVIESITGNDLGMFYLHHFEWTFIDLFLSWAPVFYLEPLAAIVEVIIILTLILSWILLNKKNFMEINDEIQAKNYQLLIIGAIMLFILALGSLF